MANQAPHWDIAAIMAGSAPINEKITFIQNQITTTQQAVQAEVTPQDADLDLESLHGLLLTTINGDYGLPEQRVRVQYLSNDQQLLVPSPLAMSPIPAVVGQVPTSAILLTRFHKVSDMNMNAIRTLATQYPNPIDLRAAIDALPAVNLVARVWTNENEYDTGNEPAVEKGQRNLYYTLISVACQFNCDIRDMGALTQPEMRAIDRFYDPIQPIERLTSRLFPFSIQTIASLNLANVGQNAVAAYTRAMGVSAGILPSPNSLSVIEYRFVMTPSTKAMRDRIVATEMEYGENLGGLCMNIIAMFGLMHLNKDHTYRTGDATMLRVGKSYINTLRTIVTDTQIEHLNGAMEAIVRTAAHPFGLGQTYGVAQALAQADRLAPALALRRRVAPPVTQRFFIVRAATREWSALPTGRFFNEQYAQDRQAVEAMCDSIEQNPTSYSALYRLYGHAAQAVIPVEYENALASLLPIVAGYAESQHVDPTGNKDGIALALSLLNIRRDNAGLVNYYKTQWDNYIEEMETKGLHTLMTEAAKQQGGGA